MTVKPNVVGGALIKAPGALEPVVADQGPQGLSAFQVWLAAGNTGTLAQYMASLAGATGSSGWSPVLAGELDGVRTIIKVADWIGSAGTKPAIGMYIGASGYVTTKANAFNFNAAKRVLAFSGVTASTGIATINFATASFTNPPVVIPLPATTAALSGPTRSTIVAGSTTATSTQIKVEQQALLTAVISLLVGATANILVIET